MSDHCGGARVLPSVAGPTPAGAAAGPGTFCRTRSAAPWRGAARGWERHGGAGMAAALLEGDQGQQILEVYGRAVNSWL